MVPIAQYYEVPEVTFPVSDTFSLIVCPCVRNGMWMVTYRGKGGSVPECLSSMYTNKDLAIKACKKYVESYKSVTKPEDTSESNLPVSTPARKKGSKKDNG